jgi:hypothetical protein
MKIGKLIESGRNAKTQNGKHKRKRKCKTQKTNAITQMHMQTKDANVKRKCKTREY